MLCKKCSGNLLRIDDTVVQCQSCLTKFRVKQKTQQDSVSMSIPMSGFMNASLNNTPINNIPENPPIQNKVEIKYSIPFSSQQDQGYIEKYLTDSKKDELNRTKNDDIKSKIITNTIEPEIIDVQNAQDVNDVIKEYEQENYPEAQVLQEKIYCSNCNKPVDLKTGVCPNCNHQMPLPERKTIECPFCHYEGNNIYSEFCIKCKKDLDLERERLGIVLPKREVVSLPKKSKSGKAKGDEKTKQKASFGRLFFNFITVCLLCLEVYCLATFDFISEGSLVITSKDLLEILKTDIANITPLLEKLNLGETTVAFFTQNQIIFQVLTIAILVFFVTIVLYVVGSLFKMLFKKSVMKSVGMLSVLNFIASIILAGFCELLVYKALSSIVIGTFSPIIVLMISFIVMFISFMII